MLIIYIYVLDKGSVIEEGTHETLLTKEGGKYQTMVKMQQSVKTINTQDGLMNMAKAAVEDKEQILERVRLLSETEAIDINRRASIPAREKSVFLRLLKMNSPEWIFILMGCFVCLLGGLRGPVSSILFAKIINNFNDCKYTILSVGVDLSLDDGGYELQGASKPHVTRFQNEAKLTTTSIKHKQTIKLATGNNYDVTLEITDLSPNDAGTYKIVVKNKADEMKMMLLLHQLPHSGHYLIYCDPLPNNAYVACLEINDVNASDAGKYKIPAKNKLGDSNTHIQLNIEGIDFKLPEGIEPSFLNKPSIKQDAKTATVQIDIIADPSPSLHWTKDGKELLNVDKVVTRIERKGGNQYTISLDIKNLASSDSGVYKCTLSNECGTAVANVVIKVAGDKANLEQLDKLAPAFEKPKTTKDTKQQSIKIECRCKGKQEPKVTWKKEKTEIKETANKYKITKTKEADDTYLFILEILSATSTDTGVYKIFAKNDAGDSQALVNLTVDAEAS
ncbi:unnamed protein product, partial [Adineta steineri]